MKRTILHIEALEARIAPATVFAVEADTNKLISFDSAAPGTLLTDIAITGLPAGEIVAGVDIDQKSNTLYAVALKDDGATRSRHFYTIDPATGVATQFSPFNQTGLVDSNSVGFEVRDFTLYTTSIDDLYSSTFFNPSGGAGGGTSTLDNPGGGSEQVTAIAMSDVFGLEPVIYGYNFPLDELVTLNYNSTTNKEELTTIAHVTVNGSNISANNTNMGFDIANSPGEPEQGWLGLFRTGNGTHFYSVNLATAALTDLGPIGNGNRLIGGLTVSVVDSASAITGNTATFTEADGDTVTVAVTKGTLTAANFHMLQAGTGSFLGKLTLGAEFEGSNLTITAKAGPQGDGQVVMGDIDARTIDLGVVKIGGVIARIDVGNGAAPAQSVKSLTVSGIEKSLYSGFGSRINDGAGSILIKGDFSGSLDFSGGRIGTVTVAGDIIGGSIGSISAHVENYVIKGSIINGSVNGKSGGSVKIGGSLIGEADGNVSSVNFQPQGLKSVKIGGSMIGGYIASAGITSIKIGGAMIGSTGPFGGGVNLQNGTLKSLSVGGGILSPEGATDSLSITAERIGSVTVKGSIAGTEGSPIHIVASGKFQPTTQIEATAIGKVTIGGDLVRAHIGAGMSSSLNGFRVDAAIGAVKIGGSMVASSLTAGINIGSGITGDADDALAGGNNGTAAIIAKIASVTIGGQLRGTAGGMPDSFGIIAEQIGKLTIGKVKPPLTAAKDDLTLGFTSDVRVREL